jgi:hypothetical protein
MRSKPLVASLLVLVLMAYLGLSAHAITQQPIEDLLVCADHGGLKVPFSRAVCRAYLQTARGTPQDIAALHEGTGAAFVIQGESSIADREELLAFLVGKGLNVNHVDTHGLLPLHSAVIANSAAEVEMLLRHGANPSLVDQQFGLDPLALALKLQKERPTGVDRTAVIGKLKQAAVQGVMRK